MNRPLTKQQQIVYDFIRDKIVSRGYGPTVREIGEHMGIKSPNGVMCHLRALERKGMITRTANKSRAIELTETISRLVDAELPLKGSVSQGECLLDVDSQEKFDLAKLLMGENRIGLRVHDDSLIEAQIRRNDTLIVQTQTHAQHGQLVVARTGPSNTLIRFWFEDNGQVRLQAANRSIPPTVVERAEIIGVVVGVVRDYGL